MLIRVNITECTSAVSTDVEGSMYQHAKNLGITLITISLRFVRLCLKPHPTIDYLRLNLGHRLRSTTRTSSHYRDLARKDGVAGRLPATGARKSAWSGIVRS